MTINPDLGVLVSTILGVFVGLATIWMAIALATLYIEEWLISKLQWRSSMLRSGISNLFGDPIFSIQFYDHPLIRALYTGAERSIEPSYIPAEQFSLAVIDMIISSTSELTQLQKMIFKIRNSFFALGKEKRRLAEERLNIIQQRINTLMAMEMTEPEILEHQMDELKSEIGVLVQNIPFFVQVVEKSLLEYTSEKKQISQIMKLCIDLYGVPDTFLVEIRFGMAALSISHPNFKRVLSALFVGIEGYRSNELCVEEIQKYIELLYNHSMDRLSGWYRARARSLALLISLSLAVVANADSSQLALLLWTTTDQQPSQTAQTNLPIGWIGASLPSEADGTVALPDGTKKLCTLTALSNSEFFGIHRGNQCYPIINAPRFNDPTGWLLKMSGLVLTGIISTFLVPVIFDYMKMKVNVVDRI